MVSILINNYNNPIPLLKLCLEAARREADSVGGEVILFDDGSDNDTLDFYSYDLEEDVRPNILLRGDRHFVGYKFLSNGMRQRRAVWKALGCANHNVIMLCDGDDYFLPGKAGAVLKLFVEDPAVVCVQNASVPHIGKDPYKWVPVKNPGWYVKNFHMVDGLFQRTSSLSFRKWVVDEYFRYDHLAGDAYIDGSLARFAALNGRFANILEPLTNYYLVPKIVGQAQKDAARDERFDFVSTFTEVSYQSYRNRRFINPAWWRLQL